MIDRNDGLFSLQLVNFIRKRRNETVVFPCVKNRGFLSTGSDKKKKSILKRVRFVEKRRTNLNHCLKSGFEAVQYDLLYNENL